MKNSSDLSIKMEMLKHTMDRYDHYYDSINNKGNLFLALNTFLLGGIITRYYSIKESVGERSNLLFFTWLAAICCLLSIGFTLWAIIPYLNKHVESEKSSVMYFGDVSLLTFPNFKKKYEQITEYKKYEDYLQQVHLLAQGLQKKFFRLQIATYLLGGCFVCIIIIGIKILK
ncbi:MAG: Pycsar system effector family protein [Ginsengibacter sp.]